MFITKICMLLTSSWFLDMFLVPVIIMFLVYKYFTRKFDYWEKEDIFYFKPLPFFGNFYDTFTMKKPLAEDLQSLYDKTDEPYFGAFMFDDPILVVKSPEIIKNILIKDFSYFTDRTLANAKHSEIISNWLLFQNYPEWKRTRPKLSQIVSTGKLKMMSNTVIDISNLMKNYIKERLGVLEAKEISRKFADEITTRCFFGFKVNCFQNEQSHFNEMNKRNFEFSLRNGIIHGLYIFKPVWVNFLRLNFIRKSDMDYLLKAVKNSVNKRKTEGDWNKRKITDYIDVILEMEENDKKSNTKPSGYTLAMANSIQFYLAGEETTSSALSFTLYEMAINPEVQERARNEVFTVLEKYGKISYESTQEMKYMSMCLSETSRKYVSLQILDRKAVMDYKVPGTNFVIKKGTKIYIPYYSIHMDEKYFPEPKKYIPERFCDKNINKDGLKYLPFGAGPRVCIGERLAQMSLKICLATILSTFKIEAAATTPIPIEFEPKSFAISSKVGIPLKFKSLETSL